MRWGLRRAADGSRQARTRYHLRADGNPAVARRALMADASVEIFRARRVISLADPPASPGQTAEPDAFAVLGERIVGTGGAEDLRARFPDAMLTDLGDGVVVPGFNDSHIHPSIVAGDLLNLDVSSDAV